MVKTEVGGGGVGHGGGWERCDLCGVDAKEEEEKGVVVETEE